MGTFNRVHLLGNLGADPELRYTGAGKPVCNFRIATSEQWTDAQGEKQERTEWHRIVCWDKTAENANEYLKKGRPVLIEGRLQTREWEDKDHPDVKHYTTEIVADRVIFVGPREASKEEKPSDDSKKGNTSKGSKK